MDARARGLQHGYPGSILGDLFALKISLKNEMEERQLVIFVVLSQ